MTCRHYISPDGKVAAVVCGPAPRRKFCSVCGKPGALLCDYPEPGRKSGTCDKPLCATCARHVGKDRDHCPHHAAQERVRQLGFRFDDGGTK
ncbi:MAG: hypothetical protein A2V70_03755 [Planctomycetes bacterium RBG_13_63_9]|nr:MAG: hypothetical protein A2V70_03755 [Planctomycetes bacterium RBG_13_63_9]